MPWAEDSGRCLHATLAVTLLPTPIISQYHKPRGVWVWEFTIFKGKVNWVSGLCYVMLGSIPWKTLLNARKKKEELKKKTFAFKCVAPFHLICVERMRTSESSERENIPG